MSDDRQTPRARQPRADAMRERLTIRVSAATADAAYQLARRQNRSLGAVLRERLRRVAGADAARRQPRP